MQEALTSLDEWQFDFLTDHSALLKTLTEDPPDFVLNFCDTGFRNVATQELHVPALLEMTGVPYSGAPPAGMVLCYDKAVVRLVAGAMGVPVPQEAVIPADAPRDAIEGPGVPYPALIKPAQGDGSVGISRDAVVHDADEARRQVEWFRRELPGRTALVQEFLPGREFGLALVGNPGQEFTAFPPLEVDFSALPPGVPPILAFESKTGPDNPYSMPCAPNRTTLNPSRRSASSWFQAFWRRARPARPAAPVLLIHGNHQEYRVDRPLQHRSTGEPFENVARLEVPGSPGVGWVRVCQRVPPPVRATSRVASAGNKLVRTSSMRVRQAPQPELSSISPPVTAKPRACRASSRVRPSRAKSQSRSMLRSSKRFQSR